MDEKLKNLSAIIESEWNYVYTRLMSTKVTFIECGEKHIDAEDDKECKGALKALEFVKEHIGALK